MDFFRVRVAGSIYHYNLCSSNHDLILQDEDTGEKY